MAQAEEDDWEEPMSDGEWPGCPEDCPPFTCTGSDDDPTLTRMPLILPYRPHVRDPSTVRLVLGEGGWALKGLEDVTFDEYWQTFKKGQVHVID